MLGNNDRHSPRHGLDAERSAPSRFRAVRRPVTGAGRGHDHARRPTGDRLRQPRWDDRGPGRSAHRRRARGVRDRCDRAATAVAQYLARLGFAVQDDAVQLVSAEVARAAADSLPKLRRSDTSIVRSAAIRQTIRDLDHWLRVLDEQSDACANTTRRGVNVAACVAASIETGRRRVVPSERPQAMAPQRFRNRPAIMCRHWSRTAGELASVVVRKLSARLATFRTARVAR